MRRRAIVRPNASSKEKLSKRTKRGRKHEEVPNVYKEFSLDQCSCGEELRKKVQQDKNDKTVKVNKNCTRSMCVLRLCADPLPLFSPAGSGVAAV
jgi:hypothetical protein